MVGAEEVVVDEQFVGYVVIEKGVYIFVAVV